MLEEAVALASASRSLKSKGAADMVGTKRRAAADDTSKEGLKCMLSRPTRQRMMILRMMNV